MKMPSSSPSPSCPSACVFCIQIRTHYTASENNVCRSRQVGPGCSWNSNQHQGLWGSSTRWPLLAVSQAFSSPISKEGKVSSHLFFGMPRKHLLENPGSILSSLESAMEQRMCRDPGCWRDPLHPGRAANNQLRGPLNCSEHIKILAAAAEEHLSEVKPLEMPFISIESC